VIVSGADAPAVRSLIMAACMLAGGSAKRALGLALVAMLCTAPEQARDLSFVFSFASMWVLVVWLPQRALGRSKVVTLLLAQILPFVIGAPLSAYVFHELPTAGLMLNLVALPLSSLLVLGGLVWIAVPIDVLTQALCSGGEAMYRLAALAPAWSVIDVALWPHELGLCLLSAVAICIGRGRWPVLLTAMVMSAPWVVRATSGDAVLHTLPVGQGDGHVLFLPGGRTVVIDAGGSHDGVVDPGRRVLLPFLRAWRIGTIDALILTHAHPDHYGGMLTLAERMNVKSFVWNGQPGGRAFARLRSVLPAAAAADVPELTLLHPLGEPYFPELSLNDNSLVYLLRHGGRSVLLTGDAEALAESFLETTPVDVLKIAHHGSHTSTTSAFLQRTQPAHAIISCGLRNTFGHPHPDVLQRLTGVTVWRTDTQGHIITTLHADGRFTLRGFRD
jgi:competence protein ComEC